MTTASGHTTLICPVEHESGVLGTGPSLEYRLWHTLAERVTPPSALELSHELSSTDVTRVDDVQKALERSKYFNQTGVCSSIQATVSIRAPKLLTSSHYPCQIVVEL